MTRGERAKQFMAFDAMKGLKDALTEREERHLRVEKRELTDETIEKISKQLKKIVRGDTVQILYFNAYHERTVTGTVSQLDYALKFITIGDERIDFDDIYRIQILEHKNG
ncbi:MAG: YolD-like family protein [Clostridiales bacterium]|nr:YolD-like family protein [Clostridiales bacterium]